MKKNGIHSPRLNFKQTGGLVGFTVEFLITILNDTQVEYWLRHKSELKKKLREVFYTITTEDHPEVRDEWTLYYKTYYERHSGKPNFEQLSLLIGFTVEFLITILNDTQVEYWLRHKSELKKKLREVFYTITTEDHPEVRDEWQKFYKNYFGWDVDFSHVIISPKYNKGNWRLLFIPKDMSLNFVFSICEKLFLSWKDCEDLDKEVLRNHRNNDINYAIWIPDEKFKPDQESYMVNFCVNLEYLTLLERIILEIKYFTETGRHLNNKCQGFCYGTQGSPDIFQIHPRTYIGNCEGHFCVVWESTRNSGVASGI